MSQVSTAVSDGALAASSLYAAYLSRHIDYLSPYGLAVIGIAATLGVFRFGSKMPSARVLDSHQLFTWLGNVVGMAFLAEGLLRRNGHDDFGKMFRFIPVIFIILYKILPQSLRNIGNTLLSTLSVLAMVISSIATANFFGIWSGVGFIFAGAVIGVDGSLCGLKRVDLFHYVLAANLFLYLEALKGLFFF